MKREQPAWRKALKAPPEGRASVRIIVRTIDSTIVVDAEKCDEEKAFSLLRLFGKKQ